MSQIAAGLSVVLKASLISILTSYLSNQSSNVQSPDLAPLWSPQHQRSTTEQRPSGGNNVLHQQTLKPPHQWLLLWSP